MAKGEITVHRSGTPVRGIEVRVEWSKWYPETKQTNSEGVANFGIEGAIEYLFVAGILILQNAHLSQLQVDLDKQGKSKKGNNDVAVISSHFW